MTAAGNDFDRKVFTLSTLCHIKTHNPATPPQALEQKLKHNRLLDDIALLLVNKEHGDVAAVSMRMSHDRVDYYFAKNGPCDPSVTTFLEQVQEILSGDNPDLMARRLLNASMSACVHKFKGRITKARKAFTDCGINLGPGFRFSGSHILSSRLQQWNHLSDEKILAGFFEDLGRLDSSINALKSNRSSSIALSMKACAIGMGSPLESYPSLHARIQKLGAYYGTATLIEKLMRRPELFNIRKNIAFHEVRTPPQITIRIPSNVAVLLNELGEQDNLPTIAHEDVANKFPSLSLASASARDSKVTVSCHCELTVALYAIKYLPYSGLIELGVSKRVCWLCQRFLEILSLHSDNRIFVSEYQGKCHAGWRIPPNTPRPVETGMQQLVQEEIEEIREAIYRRKRSDSFPSDRSFLLEGESGLRDYEAMQDPNADEY